MSAPVLDTSKDVWRDCTPQDVISQLGRMNLLAISGGRVIAHERGGVTLPVGSGYAVTIDLAASDTWTVRRIFTRAGKTFLHGEMTEIYPEDLGEIAYRASCYVNVPFPVESEQVHRCVYCQQEAPLSELEPMNLAGNLAHKNPRECPAFEEG